MRQMTMLAVFLGLAIPALSSPAAAQATRTWVSGVGDDVNPCSRTAPCKTFAGAISKTAPGGEINCLDQGAYGAVTITKSIALICEGVTAGVLHSGTQGLLINAAATDTVVLKGLDINGGTPSSPGLNSLRVLNVGNLVIEDCIIRNSTSNTPNGVGVKIETGGNFKFLIKNTSIVNHGNGATGAGILILPNGGGSVSGVLDNVDISRNVFGLAVDQAGGGAGVNVTVKNSTIANNSQAGIVVVTGATGAGVMVKDSAISNNSVGLQTVGTGAIIRVGNSMITGNGTGISGANILSYGTNQLNGNGSDGTFGPVPGGLR